jgi:Domain of unknown function (DUF4394)
MVANARRGRSRITITVLAAALGLLAVLPTLFSPGPASASPDTIYAITTANALLSFDSAAPGTIASNTPITGMQAAENILGIDFRPADGQLYAVSDQNRLYTIAVATGVATQVGLDGAFTLTGTEFGFDVNPVPDRVRVVSDADRNLRLNPNNGTLAGLDVSLAYATGDANDGQDPNVVGSAYGNNFAGAPSTTLYGIDSNLDILVIQNPPNNGTLTTTGALGVDTSNLVGFDISTSGGIDTAFASLTVGGNSSFYTINLSTGAATLVGAIGTGEVIRGISAVVAQPATPTPSPAPSATPTAAPTTAATPTQVPAALPPTGGEQGSANGDTLTIVLLAAVATMSVGLLGWYGYRRATYL